MSASKRLRHFQDWYWTVEFAHRCGPMKAAVAFVTQLDADALQSLDQCRTRANHACTDPWHITGKGHGTDTAVILGLMGYAAKKLIDPDAVEAMLARRALLTKEAGDSEYRSRCIFDPAARPVIFNYDVELPRHTNGMRFVGVRCRQRRDGCSNEALLFARWRLHCSWR